MKFSKMFVLFLFLVLMTVPTFAQGTTTVVPGSPVDLKALVPFAMAIASGMCALGQGKAAASAAEAAARNPGAAPVIQLFLFLSLALIESLALFTFLIVFIKG